MRFIPKFKKLSKFYSLTDTFFLRHLTFHRTKWKKMQQLFSKSRLPKNDKPRVLCSRSLNPAISTKAWAKKSNSYLNGIHTKNKVLQYYDFSIGVKHLKKSFKKSHYDIRKSILLTFIKPEFRVDILLWRLNFFSSSYQARQSLENGEILINNYPSSISRLLLKKGDVIHFCDQDRVKLLEIKTNLKKLSLQNTFFSFIEVDFYTKTIIIIKDLKSLSIDDIMIIIKQPFNIKKLQDYILL